MSQETYLSEIENFSLRDVYERHVLMYKTTTTAKEKRD